MVGRDEVQALVALLRDEPVEKVVGRHDLLGTVIKLPETDPAGLALDADVTVSFMPDP